jgi:hypothetical protein
LDKGKSQAKFLSAAITLAHNLNRSIANNILIISFSYLSTVESDTPFFTTMNIISSFVISSILWFGGVNVPPTAKEHFNKLFPNATHISWGKEGADKYEVEFKDKGHKMSATYDAKGTFLEKEREIKETETPASVVAAAHKVNPAAKLEEFAEITRADKSVVYEVELKEKGKSTDMLFTQDGVLTQ